ncbi:hypothetical protein J3R82DRAFT_10853 [Butyriboletus roseoflavus]|nr:hypothetical protein J3R82DRAFT_10853 [Butyriboletus roseoflavus]
MKSILPCLIRSPDDQKIHFIFFYFLYLFSRLNRTTPHSAPAHPPNVPDDRMAPPPSFLFWQLLQSTSHQFALELMFALFFSCCGLRHRPHEPPGERTPLIPQSDDTPTPQPRVIDHQKLKECLGSVVRSKEGKMVNVNAQFPFNLRDPEGCSSRSSRNVSGGTLPSSRAASPSPPRPLHKSSSATSFRSDALPLVAHPPAPILNVRLVIFPRSTQSTRGRSGDPNSRTPSQDARTPSFLAMHLPAISTRYHIHNFIVSSSCRISLLRNFFPHMLSSTILPPRPAKILTHSRGNSLKISNSQKWPALAQVPTFPVLSVKNSPPH